MAAWKETGFVPDSEDEEDLLDLDLDLELDGQKSAPEGDGDGVGDVDAQEREKEKETRDLGGRGDVDWDVPDSPQKITVSVTAAVESRLERRFALAPAASTLERQRFEESEKEIDGTIEQEKQQDGNKDELVERAPSSSRIPQISLSGQDDKAESLTATLLQKELDTGLNLVRELLSSPSPVAGPAKVYDILGSPLGSPLSSAPNSPSRLRSKSPARSISNSSSRPVPDKEARTPLPGVGIDDFEATSGRRNFRARKPIQQHPYLLEDARYKMDMMSRGLKPVSTAAHTQPRPEASTETQDNARPIDFDDECIAPSSPQRPTRPLQLPNRLPENGLSNQDELISSQESDGFSDIFNTRRNRDALGSSSPIRSRLKPVNDTRKSLHRQLEVELGTDHPVQDGTSQIPDQSLPRSTRLFSPLDSLSDESDAERSRAPIDSTPPPFITPGTSSAMHSLAERNSLSRQSRTLNNHFSLDSSSEEFSDPGPEQQDREILKYQRRVRGTLPASFMRLQNPNASQAQQTRPRPAQSPDQPAQGPGVALRVTRPHSSGGAVSRFDSFSLSEESSSEDDVPRNDARPSSLPRVSSWSPQDLVMDEGDVMEDNRIDAMAPPAIRRPRKSGSKKRQCRISEYGGHPRGLTLHENRVQKTKRRRREPTQEKPSRVRRPAKTGVRVLDAPGIRVLSRAQQPSFLRVAARQARSSKRRINLSPSQKIIRLETLADTREADEELRTWQVSLTRGGDQSREPDAGRPYSDRATNGSTRRTQGYSMALQGGLDPEGVEGGPTNATEETIQRIIRRQRGILEPEARPSAPVATAPVNRLPATAQPLDRLRAAHTNRSGSGVMMTSTHHFARQRQALLETHFPPRHPDKPRRPRFEERPAYELPMPSMLPTPPTTFDEFSSVSPPAVTEAVANPIRAAPRKRTPQAVNIRALDTAWEVVSSQASDEGEGVVEQPVSGVVLLGLGSPEYPMSIDFGVKPFAEKSHVSSESIIGGGILLKSIQSFVHTPRDMMGQSNEAWTITRLGSNGPTYHWGSWNAQVARDFTDWFTDLKDLMATSQSVGDSPASYRPSIRSLLGYVADQIRFTSEESVTNFAQTVVGLLTDISSNLDVAHWERSALSAHMCISSFLLTLAFDVTRIIPLQSIDKEVEAEALKAFHSLALHALTAVFRDCLGGDVPSSQTVCNTSMALDHPATEVLSVVHNLTRYVPQVDMWKLIEAALQSVICTAPDQLTTFFDYDRWWKGIFTVLPALEIDASGTVRPKSGPAGWNLAQRLLERFFSVFLGRRLSTGYSTKTYGRMLLFRCLRLVESWGWQSGHSAIGAVYEAFNLNQLQDIFGGKASTRFSLETRLYPGQSASVDIGNSGFHIFLSTLSSAIHDCSRPGADPTLAKRFIRSLNSRLAHQKGRDFSRLNIPTWSQQISLRNAFDLRAVMFCMMPSDQNALIEPLQSIVDFRTADRQAWKAASECWLELVRYLNLPRVVSEKAALPSSVSISDSFLALKAWHCHMITELLSELDLIEQGSLEVTAQEQSYRNEARLILSDRRKPFLDALTETLKSLREAFRFCPSAPQAIALVDHARLEKIFQFFDPRDAQKNIVISEALRVVSEYTLKCVPRPVLLGSEEDDSQQYGSWDHFNDLMDAEDDQEPTNPGVDSLLSDVLPVLSRFVTTSFGSDAFPDPKLLKLTTETWFAVAEALVRSKAKRWEDFIEPYSSTSWESLRPTPQTQQYQSLFLALIVEHAANFYERHRIYFLGIWLSSLCRPKSLLRWEHLLTSAILFHDPDNELLFNTPFTVRQDDGERCSLSAFEVYDRRKDMMYTVLRNMHRMVTAPAPMSQTPFTCSKTDLSNLLKRMESTIHNSYLDLPERSPAQIEYRDFLSSFVQQEQLYAVDFHKIDPFLLDPVISSAESRQVFTTFKRYGLTIRRTGVTQTMVRYLYYVSEKAAVLNTQGHLIAELQDAFLDLRPEAIEAEDNDNDVALLALFCKHVFPAYLEFALAGPQDHVAVPIIDFLTFVFTNLHCREDFWTPVAMRELVSGTKSILEAITASIRWAVTNEEKDPIVQFQYLPKAMQLIQAIMLRVYEACEASPEEIDPGGIFDVLLTARHWILECCGFFRLPNTRYYESFMDGQEVDQCDYSLFDSPISLYARSELKRELGQWQHLHRRGYSILGKGRMNDSWVPMTPPTDEDGRWIPEFAEATSQALTEFMEAFDSLDCWD